MKHLHIVAFLMLVPVAVTSASQDEAESGYRMPPPELVEIIDAPPTPSVDIGPRRMHLLIQERPALPSIAEVAQPELRLAGIRLNPVTNAPSRERYSSGLLLRALDGGAERRIELPDGARIDSVRWAPDGATLAFGLATEAGTELWVADVATARARRLSELQLNGVLGTAYVWSPDSRSLLCLAVPADRPEPPATPSVPKGPAIRESTGRKAAAWTYQDLLTNAHDEELFAYYATSQLARVTLDGRVRPIGEPGLVRRVSPSPGGAYLLVETIHRPFSYLVPAYRFPRRIEILDVLGEHVHLFADMPLQEEIPLGHGAVATGPRSLGWRADAPATLSWVEALDGGDPKVQAEKRDRVFVHAAPFSGERRVLLDLEFRLMGIQWGSDDLALVTESWRKTRQTRTWRLAPGRPDVAPRAIFDRSSEDRYGDPGRPVTWPTATGRSVLLTADGGRALFLSGRGASPAGDRPFLDRLDLATLETTRLWRSAAPYYESISALLDPGAQRMLTRRESPSEPPNYFVRQTAGGEPKRLTSFPHPAPSLRDASREVIRYTRDDGVELTATLYLPPGYSQEEDGPLPVLMWAYPREYKSAALAGQMRGSPYRFLRTSWSSPTLFLTRGYAVLDGPTMPIIGEGDTQPNDGFVEQLVASAQAAVDELVRRGVGDPDRMAIGGHSYGAFMGANLLAHSDLFRTAIARSGAYNRTLTPFGFQAEERTFWEAPEVYFGMSPFMHADHVNEPVLLIHGEADNNSGTFPLQSQRFYHALKGHGALVRLVMLPHESHGYRARESVMHTLWEQDAWLEKYVKNVRAK